MRAHAETARHRLTAASLFAAFLAWGGAFARNDLLAFTLAMAALLVALGWIDARTYRLPNALNLALALSGIAMVVIHMPAEGIDHALGGFVGYGALVAVEIAYRRLRGVDGLGRGDAKLFGALGIWTGWQGLPLILLGASATGIVFAAALGVRAGRFDGRLEIAFGPFLCLAGFVVWLYGAPLISV